MSYETRVTVFNFQVTPDVNSDRAYYRYLSFGASRSPFVR